MKHWIVVMVSTALTACGAAGPAADPPPVPVAVTKLVHQLQSQPPANPPAYVASYEYRSQVVYYIPPRCCDIFGDLYDATGQLICHPDGGLAGHGDGRCPDFLGQRKNETIIWRDSRRTG